VLTFTCTLNDQTDSQEKRVVDRVGDPWVDMFWLAMVITWQAFKSPVGQGNGR